MTAASPSLAARRAMIDSQLRPQGVNDPRVLAAMAAVAREDHAPAALAPVAYLDRSLPLGNGAALMPAAAFGALVQALDLQPGQRVLLVSPAPAYAAAVLGALGVIVTTQSDRDAAAATADEGGFDAILLDGAAEAIPAALTDRLVPGGRFAGAIAERGVTRLVSGRRADAQGGIALTRFADADVPVLAAFDRPRAFAF